MSTRLTRRPLALLALALAGATLLAPTHAAPAPTPRAQHGTPVALGHVPTLRITTLGEVTLDGVPLNGAGAPINAEGGGVSGGASGGGGGTDYGCPQLVAHTDASFTGGQYVAQAGFSETEMLASTYTFQANAFPLKFVQAEAIFVTVNASVQTVTEWSLRLYEGTPTSGRLIATFDSDDVTLPHLRIGPGTAGVNLQVAVDPADPDQIFFQNFAGLGQVTVAFQIRKHNSQTQNPCFIAPPRALNAFPATDTSGLQQPANNWLFAVNCGPIGCPPNGGWARFQNLAAGTCRPSGDWVMRATFDPFECPGTPGACCFSTGGCLLLPGNDCRTAGGAFAGAGTTCADLNNNGRPDICEAPACCVDFSRDGELTFDDIQLFVQAFNAQRAGACQPAPTPLGADFNNDTEFTFDDITLFVSRYNQGC